MGWTTSSNNINFGLPQKHVYAILLGDNDVIKLTTIFLFFWKNRNKKTNKFFFRTS